MVGETSVDLFDVSYTCGAAGWRREAVVAVELQVDCVFEALPFRVCEEVAPFGIAVGDCLVRAECLGLWSCQWWIR